MRKMVCWKPSVDGDDGGGDFSGRTNGLMWHKDLGTHVNGEFSMAVIQANSLLEDQSQLVSGPLSSLNSGPCGTFIGVYDGHGGPETSRFVNDNLFLNLKSMFYSDLSSYFSLNQVVILVCRKILNFIELHIVIRIKLSTSLILKIVWQLNVALLISTKM